MTFIIKSLSRSKVLSAILIISGDVSTAVCKIKLSSLLKNFQTRQVAESIGE